MIHIGDCIEVMRNMPADSVDLIMTSPPYAERRKRQYGGIPADRYPQWITERATEMWRILKPTGSFVLNIKEGAEQGERSLYVMKSVLEIVGRGWRYTDEFIWHKKNAFPGRYPGRLRDQFERCYHFTKTPDYKFRKESIYVPPSPVTVQRAQRLKPRDYKRHKNKAGSGFASTRANSVNRTGVDPGNVLFMAVESHNKGHPAVYPVRLPTFFISLLTDIGDTVLDPFLGSGTTAVAAANLGRKWIGIERSEKYAEVARKRIESETAQGRLAI